MELLLVLILIAVGGLPLLIFAALAPLIGAIICFILFLVLGVVVTAVESLGSAIPSVPESVQTFLGLTFCVSWFFFVGYSVYLGHKRQPIESAPSPTVPPHSPLERFLAAGTPAGSAGTSRSDKPA